MSRKEIYIEESDKNELELIVAEVNGKSVQTFLSDLFFAWANVIKDGHSVADLTVSLDVTRDNQQKVTYLHHEDVSYLLRIEAVKNKTNLTNYLRSIVQWICKEHRTNGRVWIDDTPVRALPIRMRK